jgi:hypothetical protein
MHLHRLQHENGKRQWRQNQNRGFFRVKGLHIQYLSLTADPAMQMPMALG